MRDDRWDGFKTVKYWPTLYQADPDGEFETLEGTKVTPVKKMDDWKDPKYYEKDVDKFIENEKLYLFVAVNTDLDAPLRI